MKINSTQDAWRKKILNLLPRRFLEEVSDMKQPWNADRATLIATALHGWTDDTADEIFAFLHKRTGFKS
jgi:hypothetical protein